jgi:uncharacterized membrane protein
MANGLYALARAASLQGGLNMSAGTVKCAMVTASYVANLSTDQFWSSAVAAVVGTPQALTTKTFTAGTFDADDVTYTAVTSGSTVTALVIYVDTGTTTTSPLIAYIDTATGLPVLTNGGNIVVTWDSGANKIFTI